MDEWKHNMGYEEFVERLKKSQDAVFFMKDYFESKNFEVEVPELVVAPTSVGSFSKYADNGDMFITKNGVREKVEIKQSSKKFDLNNWYFDTIIINSIPGYDSKNPKPDIHIILSSDREYGYAIRKDVFEKEKFKKKIYDKFKKTELWFYLVKKEFVTFFKINKSDC
jgi:hypothetical protein